MTPKKPDWFELTEGENSPAQVRRINKKLPIAALAAAGAIIVAGSLFANANDEQSAVADTPATSQSAVADTPATSQSAVADTPATSQSAPATASAPATRISKTPPSTPPQTPAAKASGMNSLPVPTVTNVPKRGDGDHEGRERGEHREGERHEGERSEHDD
jgi:cytoskeletal protein RodZ